MKIAKSAFLFSGFLGCALLASNIQAQSSSSYHPFTVGAEIGTTGYGGTAIYRFMDHLGVSGGLDYFSYRRTGTIKDVDYSARARMMTEPVALCLYPSADSSFHIKLGAVFNQTRVTGTNPNGTFTINNNTYAGSINLDYQQQPVDPFVSIAGNFFCFDHGHHVSIGGELGCMYTGEPRVGLVSSNPAANADIASQRDKLIHYARDLEFWPILKLGVNISF